MLVTPSCISALVTCPLYVFRLAFHPVIPVSELIVSLPSASSTQPSPESILSACGAGSAAIITLCGSAAGSISVPLSTVPAEFPLTLPCANTVIETASHTMPVISTAESSTDIILCNKLPFRFFIFSNIPPSFQVLFLFYRRLFRLRFTFYSINHTLYEIGMCSLCFFTLICYNKFLNTLSYPKEGAPYAA